MLIRFTALLEAYEALFAMLPWWGVILYIGVHAIAVLICLGREGFHPFSEAEEEHCNTLNSIVWLCVLFVFPVIGIVLYFLLGILPYSIWSSKHSLKKECPLVFIPTWMEYVIPIGAGIVAELVQTVFRGFISFPSELAFEVAMIIWLLMTMIAWWDERNTILLLEPCYLDINEPAEPVFGKTCRREYARSPRDKAYARMEAKAARKLSDRTWGSGWQKLTHEVRIGSETFSFAGKSVKPSAIADYDVIDESYAGYGVTRMTYLQWQKDKESCTEKYAFLVSAPVIRIMIQLFLILAVIFMLFTPVFGDIHLSLLHTLQEIIGNFVN